MVPNTSPSRISIFILILGISAWLAVVVASLSGCTLSMTMVHTEGHAEDVVDDADTVTPSTSLTVPVTALPTL